MTRKIVYFIQRGPDGPVKIGVARDPYARLETLQVASPEKLKLIGCFRGSEADLHRRFQEHRISGEWFGPHEDILKFARSSASFPRLRRPRYAQIKVIVPGRLLAAMEIERKRMSRAIGFEAQMGAVVRWLLESSLR